MATEKSSEDQTPAIILSPTRAAAAPRPPPLPPPPYTCEIRNEKAPADGFETNGKFTTRPTALKPQPRSVSDTTKMPPEKFDPHHFGRADGIGFMGASVHIVRLTIGSGILVLPYAMKNLGYVSGTALIMFVGLLYYHNVHTLVRVEYYLCQQSRLPRLSFIGVVQAAFQRASYPLNKLGPSVRYLTYFYFGSPTALASYLIVIATNIEHLAAHYDVQLRRTYIVTTIIGPFTLACLVRRILKILVPFSSLSNILTFAMAGTLIGCSVVYREPNPSPQAFGELSFAPKGFAMFILAIRSMGIVLPVKNDMQQPKQFSRWYGSLNVAGLTIVAVYYVFALACYLNYGDSVQENALLNLPQKNLISFSVYALYTMALSVSYVLSFFVCFDCLWSSELETTLKPGACKTLLEFGIRIAINALAYLLAVAVPQISLIAAMAGTVGTLVEITLPPLLELILIVDKKRKNCLVVLKNLFIVAVSAVLFCMSAKRCLTDLLQLYHTMTL